ncbi:TPA: hypothetical protein DD425_02095 [Candidatus Saccharibacteria bacterium]|nr:hypothetical protein [Candidatus Saccharibacteria bacterium]|tara:strand:+ start:3133 stop:4212 length:1080 start_codon:yes stop_codon:yes gene_type:complete
MTEDQIDSFDFRVQRADILTKIATRIESSLEGSIDAPIDRVYRLLASGEDDFLKTVTSVNRIITKNHHPTAETGFFADRAMHIGRPDEPEYMHVLPAVEDKMPLMRYLYTTLIAMYQGGADAEHIAGVLGQGINAIHPFNDANGRTARALHGVLTRNIAGDKENLLYYRAIDTIDNTESLSPAPFEDSIFDAMKLRYGTHYNKEGVLVPRVRFAGTEATIASIGEDALSSEQPRARAAGLIYGALNDPHVSPIVAGILEKSLAQKNDLIKRSCMSYNGAAIFNVDIFYSQATDADLTEVTTLIRGIHNQYVVELLNFISGRALPDSTVTVETNERGQVTLGIGEYIAQMASHAITRALN